MLLFSLLLTITAAQANDQCFGRGEDSTGNNNPMCEAQFIPHACAAIPHCFWVPGRTVCQ
jgi:hypothetical protein